MSKLSIIRTAESVSPRHPDKICDQISDCILDAYLALDPNARVAVETVGGHGKLLVIGEVTSSRDVDIKNTIARLTAGLDVEVRISKQSEEIGRGVDVGGAGDQGIMIGYACDETAESLPLEVILSRKLNQYLYDRWPFDGKTQVTVKNGHVESIVASFQNAPSSDLSDAVSTWINRIGSKINNRAIEIHINPAGDWNIGGFDADTGLTGRKLAVDNYGPRIPIGGGAFSGKDPSKVDRSAAYMARKIALDYMNSRKASEVLVNLAYAIGKSEPLQATAVIDGLSEKISGYNLTPDGIIEHLDLKQPIYYQTASYGHFGHSQFMWEK